MSVLVEMLCVFLYLVITEEGAGSSLAGLRRGRLSLTTFGIRVHHGCKKILQEERVCFLKLKRPDLNRFRASTRHFAEYFTSSSSSSNSDKAALLVLLWLEISGLDLLLGMAGNS